MATGVLRTKVDRKEGEERDRKKRGDKWGGGTEEVSGQEGKRR